MDADKRHLVLVVGESPLSLVSFAERDLRIQRVTANDAPNLFTEACAVIIADFADKFGLIQDSYAGLFPNALDHGLTQVVIVHTQENLIQVAGIKQKDFKDSKARIFLVNETSKAAQFIARHRAGPPAGNVIIEPGSIVLSDDKRLLLRRAFSDCERIFLEPITGGKASIDVFRAHAWLRQPLVGPRPLPFFVKIAAPPVVEKEREKYKLYAEHYIPFNLRPNLDQGRCVCTRAHAALVGDFVDDAIPLRQSLRSGHGIGALFSLFETSLKSFRLQPFVAEEKPMGNMLAGFAKGCIRAHKLPPAMVEQARTFGLTADPESLQLKVCNAAEAVSCFVGAFHGDLHPGNIMVRGGDAILIDFNSAGKGPLTADPAALEVSLMFGTDEDDAPGCFPEWREFIDEVYPIDSNLHPSALFDIMPGGMFSWLRRSLRELRHILLGCNAGVTEARIVLAAYLLRYARLGVEDVPDDNRKKLAFDRHAYALVVAERIVQALSAPT